MPTLTTAFPDVFQGIPGIGYPNSIAELKKAQLRGPEYHFLRRMANRDVIFLHDDFNTLSISAANWAVANGGGAGAASFATQTLVNGVIRATTGTANGATASASLIGPVIYPGTSNPGIEVRFKTVTASTSIRMEIGWIDAVPASNTSAVNSADTPTFFSANSVTAFIDTSATANLFNLYTIGNATNQAAKKVVGTTGLAAAGVYQTIRLQLFSQDNSVANSVNAAMWHNGQRVATADSAATAGVGVVNGSVLLAPWVYIEAINATSKSLDLDYVAMWADRGV